MHAYQEKKLVGIKPTMNRPRAASDTSTMTTQTDDLCEYHSLIKQWCQQLSTTEEK